MPYIASHFREYKESLRLQRTVDSVYKCPQREVNGNSKPPIPPEPVPVSLHITFKHQNASVLTNSLILRSQRAHLRIAK